MALQQLKSVQFDHYIPFATTSSGGTIDFGETSIKAGDIVTDTIEVCGYISASGFSVSCGGNVESSGYISADCGITTNGGIYACGFSVSCGGNIESCGDIYAAYSIYTNGDIYACGFSVSCGGNITTCGDISAAGGGSIGGVSFANSGISAGGVISANGLSTHSLSLSGYEIYLDNGIVKYR